MTREQPMRIRSLLVTVAVALTLGVPMVAADHESPHVCEVSPGQEIGPLVGPDSVCDVVRLLPGTYNEAVVIQRAGLVFEGATGDAPDVVIDTQRKAAVSVQVRADRVTTRDFTVTGHTDHGLAYVQADHFLVENVHAFGFDENGESGATYGIYIIEGEIGEVRDSYAAGYGDAAFYVGHTPYCRCLLEDNLGEWSVQGYSGTANSWITIRGNEFRNNRAGILMSVLPPQFEDQVRGTIEFNHVHDNNFPAKPLGFTQDITPPTGIGIALGGGSHNMVRNNMVEDNQLFGSAQFFLFREPSFNQWVDNHYMGNGVDIWWDEGGINNCFEEPTRASSDPPILPGCDAPNVGVPNPYKLALLAYWAAVNGGEPGDPVNDLLDDPPY